MSYWWWREWKARTELQCLGQEGSHRQCWGVETLWANSPAWHNDSSIPKQRNSLCFLDHLETTALPCSMHVGWGNGGSSTLSRFCHQNVMSGSHRLMNQPPSERWVGKQGERWRFIPSSKGHLAVLQSSRIRSSSAPSAKRVPGTARDPHPLSPLGKARVNWSLYIPVLSFLPVCCYVSWHICVTAHRNVGTSPPCLLVFSDLFFSGSLFSDPENRERFSYLWYIFIYIIYYVFLILDSCYRYGLSCKPKQI